MLCEMHHLVYPFFQQHLYFFGQIITRIVDLLLENQAFCLKNEDGSVYLL